MVLITSKMRVALDDYDKAKTYFAAFNADADFRSSMFSAAASRDAFRATQLKSFAAIEQKMLREALAAQANKRKCKNAKWFAEGKAWNREHLVAALGALDRPRPSWKKVLHETVACVNNVADWLEVDRPSFPAEN